MKTAYTYVAVLDFSGKHIAITFPDLREAISQADNIEQAIHRAHEVLQLTIESRLGDDELIPAPTSERLIQLTPNQKSTLITVNVERNE